MQINQDQEKNMLDYLKESKENPEIILRELFSYGVGGMNFLNQVHPDGESISDYCIRQLAMLPMFQACVIEQDFFDFRIYLESEYEVGYLNEPIVKIDANDKTFSMPCDVIKMYQDALDNPLPTKPGEIELSDSWKVFTDFSTVKKPRVAIQAFNQLEGNVLGRLRGSLKILCMPTARVVAAYKKQVAFVGYINEYNMKSYQISLQRQTKMRSVALERIGELKEKQQEIADFLIKLGYTQNNLRDDFTEEV